jgi:hypothetical protein
MHATHSFGISVAFDYTRFCLKRDDGTTLVDFRHSDYGPRRDVVLSF